VPTIYQKEVMDEKKRAIKKLMAGQKKPSMKRRDDYNDYRGRRMYMVTIEVEGRRPLFGTLRGDADAAPGTAEAPHIELSPLGQAVSQEWMGIARYYPQIEVMGLQMMPDHLHGILFVHEALPVHLGQVITGFKTGCNRILRSLSNTATEPQPTPNGGTKPQPAQNAATEPQPTPNGWRGASQVARQAVAPSQQLPSLPLFAPNYNDLILKNYDEFRIWKKYLADNPRRLMVKRAKPALLTPFFGLRIGSHTYNGIGNRQLLSAASLVAVRLSRRLTEQQIEAEAARYMALAREGAILVSPAISPGEKKVMRQAFNAGLPMVIILPNGFTPLSKPHGEQFDACAEGRLLMLSAWEHQNERKPLTASQCQQMNLMALELCEKKTPERTI
jgi:hypothetical protein